jgi:hypothetical protein
VPVAPDPLTLVGGDSRVRTGDTSARGASNRSVARGSTTSPAHAQWSETRKTIRCSWAAATNGVADSTECPQTPRQTNASGSLRDLFGLTALRIATLVSIVAIALLLAFRRFATRSAALLRSVRTTESRS